MEEEFKKILTGSVILDNKYENEEKQYMLLRWRSFPETKIKTKANNQCILVSNNQKLRRCDVFKSNNSKNFS